MGPARAAQTSSCNTVTGGGHAWPQGPQYLPKLIVGTASNQLDADQAIVDFCYAHPLR
jgi:poly(3-hydroxybutyrate) depolymerase